MDKKRFIEFELQALLKKADDNVMSVYYSKFGKSEFANITVKNGSPYEINITGNSLIAIVADVTKAMMW